MDTNDSTLVNTADQLRERVRQIQGDDESPLIPGLRDLLTIAALMDRVDALEQQRLGRER